MESLEYGIMGGVVKDEVHDDSYFEFVCLFDKLFELFEGVGKVRFFIVCVEGEFRVDTFVVFDAVGTAGLEVAWQQVVRVGVAVEFSDLVDGIQVEDVDAHFFESFKMFFEVVEGSCGSGSDYFSVFYLFCSKEAYECVVDDGICDPGGLDVYFCVCAFVLFFEPCPVFLVFFSVAVEDSGSSGVGAADVSSESEEGVFFFVKFECVAVEALSFFIFYV